MLTVISSYAMQIIASLSLLLNYTLQFPAAAVDVSSCCIAESQQKPSSSKGGLFPAEGSCEGVFHHATCLTQPNYTQGPTVAFPLSCHEYEPL